MRETLPVPDVPTVDPAAAVPHIASVGALVATAFGYLPVIVALIPAIYYLILIYESKTVQDWVARRREAKRIKQLAKLQAQALVVNAQIEAAAEVKTARVFAAAKVDNAAVDAATLVKKVDAGTHDPTSTPPAASV
jgi:hypothetical protein